MAREEDNNQLGEEVGRSPPDAAQNNEFENAVTTEISDVLARAFDEDQTSDPSDVHITDMQLAVHVDLAADDALPPGIFLNDRFEITELVHTGGMSHVYKAVDHRRHPESSGEIHVAIKMMRPAVASDKEARMTLEREAAKAQSLSHPNIINIFDFDEHENQFFLVMEWLEGESVNALLRRTSGERLSSSFAWPVIEGAAAGVQHAHLKNVVHADINPSNIFITDEQDIKLLDFGVARYTNNSDQPEDDRLAWVTQTYASPEVLSGLTPVVEDDVFSLACVAYRLLNGKHPFGGAPSLVAKHQGMSVEPIQGLPDEEWQLLRRALSFQRSDRPTSISELINRGTNSTGAGESTGRQTRQASRYLQTSLAAIILVVILAGGLWFFQREAVSPIEPEVPDEAVVADAVDAPAPSAAEALVTAALQALGDGRFVAPDDSNARALFRQALLLEPENAEALRGLRAISDNFVQEAQEALNADDPLTAYAALAVAAETDPSNPAIEIIDQLLAAKGSGELADARLAAATGDLDLAALHLTRAERYSHIDLAMTESLRRQIAQGKRDGELLDSLATADAHLIAGRLISPEGENAHALLLETSEQHGDDQRLRASMERLGERLLTRAAFAAASSRNAEATELLDAVGALGVFGPEVEAARASFATEATATDTEDVSGPEVAEQRGVDPQPMASAIGTATDASATTTPAAAPQSTVAAVRPEAGGETAIMEDAGSQAEAVGAGPVVQRKSVREFGIKRYVAPVYPRRARHRGLTGKVDVEFVINPDGGTDSIRVLHSEPGAVFAESAVDAVNKWRFIPREENVRARITLVFDLAP